MLRLRLNRRTIEVQHPEKIFFPDDNLTKEDLISYYQEIAPYYLPYTRNRLITMQRFPDGIAGESFYQKNAAQYFPDWMSTVPVRRQTGGTVHYVVCQDTATLIYLVNQGCITLHRWLSPLSSLQKPDLIVFDIDPPHEGNIPFDHIRQVAYVLKKSIESLGLTAWVMTTGSRGLHVAIPIIPEYNFTQVRSFARMLAGRIVAQDQKFLTLDVRSEHRKNKLLIDIMRNGFGATAVVPYALRALSGAPVATPLHWDELESIASAQEYTINTIMPRLKKLGDPWHGMQRQRRSLKKLIGRALRGISKQPFS